MWRPASGRLVSRVVISCRAVLVLFLSSPCLALLDGRAMAGSMDPPGVVGEDVSDAADPILTYMFAGTNGDGKAITGSFQYDTANIMTVGGQSRLLMTKLMNIMFTTPDGAKFTDLVPPIAQNNYPFAYISIDPKSYEFTNQGNPTLYLAPTGKTTPVLVVDVMAMNKQSWTYIKGNTSIDSGTGNWTVAVSVPEPSGLILAGIGGIVLLARRHGRRRRDG